MIVTTLFLVAIIAIVTKHKKISLLFFFLFIGEFFGFCSKVITIIPWSSVITGLVIMVFLIFIVSGLYDFRGVKGRENI